MGREKNRLIESAYITPSWGLHTSVNLGHCVAGSRNGFLQQMEAAVQPDDSVACIHPAALTHTMPLALPPDARQEAVASVQQYAEVNLDAPLGTLAAGALLDFFLEEIGPSIYNQALRDAQERLQARLAELDVDLHQPEFTYWRVRRR